MTRPLLIILLQVLAGCRTAEQGASAREEYIAQLREIIDDAKKDPNLVITHALTDSEEQCNREMIYLDDRYLSYRIEEHWYHGGAHGGTKVSVGTLDRKTGRQLTIDDVFGKDGRAALELELHKAVVAKIGAENIQSPVKPTENFYLAADGWHFVYNEYEIACYAIGAIEIVIKPPFSSVCDSP